MSSVFRVFFIAAVLFVLSGHSFAQADEICGESAGSTWMTTPFVYGRVLLNGFEGRKLPKVTVILYDRSRSESRQTIDKSGYYCFRNTNGAGGFVAIEVEGLEVFDPLCAAAGPRNSARILRSTLHILKRQSLLRPSPLNMHIRGTEKMLSSLKRHLPPKRKSKWARRRSF